MANRADPPPAPRLRLRLVHKVAAAVLLLALLQVLLLQLVVAPSTTAAFERRADTLLDQSRAAMQALTTDHAQQSSEVLQSLIAHTTAARRRALADLPLPLFADIADVRAAVQHDDDERSQRLQGNVAVLAAESRRRADARIDAVLGQLRHEQAQLAATFGSDLRAAHLWLSAALLALALLMFGLGLWRLVVRPVDVLRAATRRLATGDLATDVAVATGDEIGGLAADFRTMVQQLRQSRQALAALNQDLERRVDEKTRELAHAAKMASLGTLAGGIAHEFNNLIGGIRGCAKEARADEADPQRQQTLDVILRAADRAAAITAQLRRFAQKEPPREVDCVLGEIVADALRLVEPEARRRGVTLERDLAAGLSLRGDDGALHQVFVNLLTNALQAMPGGGRLGVVARRDGGDLLVEVADTGVGIAPADLDRIFEPFFSRRGDDADPAQRGTGLGLSLSYGIVDAHGGTITVRSEVGAGTTFTVRLPVRAATR
jgi:signal transduction histidine kinase